MAEATDATPAADDPHAWARLYAAHHLRVLPIPPGTKAPRLPAWQNAATTDPATIDDWWTGMYRGHGVGIALDQLPDGRWLFVVDIDQHGIDGAAAWHELTDAYGTAPDTWEATTGGGGTHLVYASPLEIRNGRLTDGVDIRGHGGQIVVEPSTHPTGTRYGWVDGHEPWARPVADAPAWLVGMVAAGQTPPPPERPRTPPPDAGDRPGDLWAATTTWDQLLGADGWTLSHIDRTGEQHWTRPGKDRREGTSATVGYRGSDVLKVFTSSLAGHGLHADQTYTKLGYLAATRYDGDHSAAAAALRAEGFHAPPARLADLYDDDRPPVVATADPTGPWPDPVPMPDTEPPPPWPDDVLPDWMQAQVDNIARQIHCAADLPGMFTLGALSTVSLGHVQVEARAGHIEPTTLYLVVPAPPSEGKSAALEMAMRPVTDHEEAMIDRAAEAVATAEADRRIAEKRARALEESAAMGSDPGKELEAKEARAALAAMDAPPEGRLITADITPARLATLLAANAERLALVTDESGFLAVDRFGDKSRGSNMDLFLQAWSGRRTTVDRQNAPSVRLRRPLLTIVAGVQPESWANALTDQEFRSRGLGARFMAARPAPVGHTRIIDLDRDDWDTDVDAAYNTRLRALAADWASWQMPATIHLSSDAKRTWSAWGQPMQARMAPGGDLELEASWVSKMRDSVIRVAALLHLADGGDHRTPVDGDTMARACRLGDYWTAHRLHETSSEYADAHRLLAALVKIARTGDGKLVTRRDIGRHGPRNVRTVEEIAHPLALLAGHRWVRIHGSYAPGWKTDETALIRSMKGVEVHPSALAGETTAPRDTARHARHNPHTVTDGHGESKNVARVARVALRASDDPPPSTQSPPATRTPDPPRDTRDNPLAGTIFATSTEHPRSAG